MCSQIKKVKLPNCLDENVAICTTSKRHETAYLKSFLKILQNVEIYQRSNYTRSGSRAILTNALAIKKMLLSKLSCLQI